MTMEPGRSITADDADAFRAGVRDVVAYRGDVTVVRHDGSTIVGYLYDAAALDDPDRARVRMLPDDGAPRITIALADIARIDVTGRDTAAGKSFETYIRKYAEKLAADHGVALDRTPDGTSPDDDACASS